jgi:TPP-dependent pyruvate/acetoin dehydrogenase alpha subunit
MPGVIVDGMNPEAVYLAVTTAVERARNGGGPSLIEAMTYRYRGHYEGDPQSYRTAEEVALWQAKDPLLVYPSLLLASGVVTQDWLDATRAEISVEIDQSAERALQGALPPDDRIFEYVYAN